MLLCLSNKSFRNGWRRKFTKRYLKNNIAFRNYFFCFENLCWTPFFIRAATMSSFVKENLQGMKCSNEFIEFILKVSRGTFLFCLIVFLIKTALTVGIVDFERIHKHNSWWSEQNMPLKWEKDNSTYFHLWSSQSTCILPFLFEERSISYHSFIANWSNINSNLRLKC